MEESDGGEADNEAESSEDSDDEVSGDTESVSLSDKQDKVQEHVSEEAKQPPRQLQKRDDESSNTEVSSDGCYSEPQVNAREEN